MSSFNLQSYLRNSEKLRVDDLKVEEAGNYPLTQEEIRCLTYMMDIESNVITFLKEILSTCAIRDSRTTAFLSCWAYEEFFHSYYLRQFLEAAGVHVDENRAASVQKQTSFYHWLEGIGASMICRLTKHFHAVYLTWGAVSELMTLESYGILADRTRNPILAELLRRIAKDERRHFAFYYNMAREHLEPKTAQLITSWVLKNVWKPVGTRTRPSGEVEWMILYIFGEREGFESAKRLDTTISALPGMSWFDRINESREVALAGGAFPF